MHRLLWHEEQESLPQPALAELQLLKLRRQLRYERENSPYLKNRMDEAGFDPDRIESLGDIARIPVFTEEDHRRVQNHSVRHLGHPYGDHICASLSKVVQINAAPGTTGLPILYTFTRRDLEVTGEVIGRGLWRMGVRPGDGVIHGSALSMFAGGLPFIHAVQQLGAHTIPVGAEAGAAKFLQFAQLTRPKHMICAPSFAECLAEEAPKVIGCGVRGLGLRTLMFVGESKPGDPEGRSRLEDEWGAKVFDLLGGDWGFLCASCTESEGMHFVSPDYSLLELVDPDSKQAISIVDGAVGEMTCTSLEWEAGPALRYALGDIVQVFTSPCSCGMPGLRLKVLGRFDERSQS